MFVSLLEEKLANAYVGEFIVDERALGNGVVVLYQFN
jgi:hypothetical protein